MVLHRPVELAPFIGKFTSDKKLGRHFEYSVAPLQESTGAALAATLILKVLRYADAARHSIPILKLSGNATP